MRLKTFLDMSQVSFNVRYADDLFQPHEVFLGFYKTNKTDSETLTNLIKEVLSAK